jgi:hypothetical protein
MQELTEQLVPLMEREMEKLVDLPLRFLDKTEVRHRRRPEQYAELL